jgi:hypothetical protein
MAIDMLDINFERFSILVGEVAIAREMAIDEELFEGDKAHVHSILYHTLIAFGNDWGEIDVAVVMRELSLVMNGLLSSGKTLFSDIFLIVLRMHPCEVKPVDLLIDRHKVF